MTHEAYVGISTAMMLKRAQYDWDVETVYSRPAKDGEIMTFPTPTGKPWENDYPRPTLYEVQRWLRETKDVHLEVTALGRPAQYYTCHLKNVVEDGTIAEKKIIDGKTYFLPTHFATYEDALEAGLQQALILLYLNS